MQRKVFELNDDIKCSRLRVMITVQLHNLIFACKYNRRALRKVSSSFEEVLYIYLSTYIKVVSLRRIRNSARTLSVSYV